MARWWPVLVQLLGVAAIAAGGWLVAPALGLVLGGFGLLGAGTLAEARHLGRLGKS